MFDISLNMLQFSSYKELFNLLFGLVCSEKKGSSNKVNETAFYNVNCLIMRHWSVHKMWVGLELRLPVFGKRSFANRNWRNWSFCVDILKITSECQKLSCLELCRAFIKIFPIFYFKNWKNVLKRGERGQKSNF